MTWDGTIQPIGRHGLVGKKKSVMARAAFEETIDHLISASIKNEVDKLEGITENMIIGQVIPVGTGRVLLKIKSE
jgi:DNA-directed RNA polymerase subunit A"